MWQRRLSCSSTPRTAARPKWPPHGQHVGNHSASWIVTRKGSLAARTPGVELVVCRHCGGTYAEDARARALTCRYSGRTDWSAHRPAPHRLSSIIGRCPSKWGALPSFRVRLDKLNRRILEGLEATRYETRSLGAGNVSPECDVYPDIWIDLFFRILVNLRDSGMVDIVGILSFLCGRLRKSASEEKGVFGWFDSQMIEDQAVRSNENHE